MSSFRCSLFVALALVSAVTFAQVEVEKPVIALDAAQETRFEAMLPNLRCLVCQNQSLADSQAPLALDLRYEIRGLVAAGKSDEDIRRYLTDRYGEFVLYKPQFTPRNWLLWMGPFLLALFGVVAVVLYSRRVSGVRPPAATPDAEALRRLLAGDEAGSRPR